jgi:hypothetical protein
MSEINEFASFLRFFVARFVVAFLIALMRAAYLVDLILIMFDTG